MKNKIRNLKGQFIKGHPQVFFKHTKESKDKIRQSVLDDYYTGRKKPINYWLNKKGVYAGNKHWNWKGGITPKFIVLRQSIKFKRWREAVFARDNYTCIWCKKGNKNGERTILNADHIKPFAYHPELRFKLSNGRTLCKNCHKKTDTYQHKARWNYNGRQLCGQ